MRNDKNAFFPGTFTSLHNSTVTLADGKTTKVTGFGELELEIGEAPILSIGALDPLVKSVGLKYGAFTHDGFSLLLNSTRVVLALA
ncbi:hypothetical protein HDV05_003286 [Chytridiales sp. JEL 0842]|nr:hypothetical protein HDV05_003286 [Chytridiales sp. JEL 0842]